MSGGGDAFAVVQALLPGVELGPEQLAQVRALNREYYQRLYALRHRAGAERQAAAESEMAELEAWLTSRVREMLAAAPTTKGVRTT